MAGPFREADTENSVTISLPVFHSAIRDADLVLTLPRHLSTLRPR
jgi:hypothetical protein